jgi:uncharacterized RDD family membrane protein YckC
VRPPDEIIDGDPRQVVLSPEQVELHFPIAGPSSRMLAYAIDLLAIVTIEVVVFLSLILGSPIAEWLGQRVQEFGAQIGTPGADPFANGALLYLLEFFLLLQLAVEWGYFVFCEMATGGSSLGKRLVGLRVMRDGGMPLTLRESLLRNLLRVVDLLPANYVIGLVAMVISPEGKRLGDVAAGTIVVRLDRPAPAAPLPEQPDEADSRFRFERAQIARLGAAERALVRQTLRRLPELSAEAAEVALAHAVAALCARIGYEPVAAEDRVAFLRALWHACRER